MFTSGEDTSQTRKIKQNMTPTGMCKMTQTEESPHSEELGPNATAQHGFLGRNPRVI